MQRTRVCRLSDVMGWVSAERRTCVPTPVGHIIPQKLSTNCQSHLQKTFPRQHTHAHTHTIRINSLQFDAHEDETDTFSHVYFWLLFPGVCTHLSQSFRQDRVSGSGGPFEHLFQAFYLFRIWIQGRPHTTYSLHTQHSAFEKKIKNSLFVLVICFPFCAMCDISWSNRRNCNHCRTSFKHSWGKTRRE